MNRTFRNSAKLANQLAAWGRLRKRRQANQQWLCQRWARNAIKGKQNQLSISGLDIYYVGMYADIDVKERVRCDSIGEFNRAKGANIYWFAL